MLAELVPSGGTRRESISLAYDPYLLSHCLFSPCFCPHTAFLLFCGSFLPLPLIRSPVIALRAHRIIQNNLPVSRFLTQPHLQNVPHRSQKVHSQVPGIRTWTSLGVVSQLIWDHHAPVLSLTSQSRIQSIKAVNNKCGSCSGPGWALEPGVLYSFTSCLPCEMGLQSAAYRCRHRGSERCSGFHTSSLHGGYA